MMLNWSNTGLTLLCCSRGQPSLNLPFKAWLCKGGSRKNRTLPHGSFSLQYYVYSETFIAAQQSKNVLHENCTGKSRARKSWGRVQIKTRMERQLQNMPLETDEGMNTLLLSQQPGRHWNWCNSQTPTVWSMLVSGRAQPSLGTAWDRIPGTMGELGMCSGAHLRQGPVPPALEPSLTQRCRGRDSHARTGAADSQP